MRSIHIERGVLLTLMLLALLVTARARAESAAYVDGVLLLPQVLLTDSQTPQMVANAELRLNAEGTFDIVASGTRPMTRFQSFSTLALVKRGDFAVVHLTVLKQWECAQVDPVHVLRQGQAFYLAVTEGPVPDNVRCRRGTQPVHMQVALDTSPLQPGEYQIYAHGLYLNFTVLEP